VLLVVPGVASAAGIISALSVSPSSVQGGASAQGTVTLIPDVTPTTVLLFSSDPSVATVPASVVAPAGQGTVTFTIGTNAAAPATIVQITAAIQNVPHMANLSVNAATPPGPSQSSVSVTPSSLTGGSPATGRSPSTASPTGRPSNCPAATRPWSCGDRSFARLLGHLLGVCADPIC
jgi:hypothetical protein